MCVPRDVRVCIRAIVNLTKLGFSARARLHVLCGLRSWLTACADAKRKSLRCLETMLLSTGCLGLSPCASNGDGLLCSVLLSTQLSAGAAIAGLRTACSCIEHLPSGTLIQPPDPTRSDSQRDRYRLLFPFPGHAFAPFY